MPVGAASRLGMRKASRSRRWDEAREGWRSELPRCPRSAWLSGSPPWGQAPPPGVRPHLAEPDPIWRLAVGKWQARRLAFGRCGRLAAMLLYNNPASSNALKVRFLLAELGLAYDSREVPMPQPRPDWYLDRNPLGGIPALDDDGLVLA